MEKLGLQEPLNTLFVWCPRSTRTLYQNISLRPHDSHFLSRQEKQRHTAGQGLAQSCRGRWGRAGGSLRLAGPHGGPVLTFT